MLSTYYEILGLSPDASDQEIRRAYRKKAKQYHPDINKSPEANAQFLLIKKAYEILSNRDSYRYQPSARSNPMSSYEAYMRWKKAQEEKAQQDARMRYQEFLKNREKFRESMWYYPLLAFVYIAVTFAYLFGACIIFLCAYLVHKTHIAFVLLVLPFISGAVYFIKCTGSWYREVKKNF